MTQKFIKLDDLITYIKSNGFTYSEEQIYNILISLKTKPFLILSGISGTGKTKVIQLIADYFSETLDYTDNYELVSVKPNWIDSRGIFGYHNIMDDTYSITQTVKLFIRAATNPQKPYFLLLDEMNLARVEHYFSDFLSVLESRRYTNKDISDYNTTVSNEFVEQLLKQFGDNISLSAAIVISALLKNNNSFESVEYYRNTAIIKWWFNTFSKGVNKAPQFRSELNQNRKNREDDSGLKTDGTRLAGKLFLGKVSGNLYKLKEESEMDDEQVKEFRTIKDKLLRVLDATKDTYIKQEPILLHNSENILKVDPKQQEYSKLKPLPLDYYIPNEGYYVPSLLPIPTNIFVIGTVNVDETTFNFSPKVLDRSNVIEFNEVNLYSAFQYGQPLNTLHTNYVNENYIDYTISLPTSEDTKFFLNTYPQHFEILVSVFRVLKKYNKHFGYRVFNEISKYIFNFNGTSGNDNQLNDSLDLQILQKILPKLNGSVDELLELLDELKILLQNNNLPRSTEKVVEMITDLEVTGFTTYL